MNVRDHSSFSFALVSVAAAHDLDAGHIRNARIALGGVAHKPWRAKEAEKELSGGTISASLFESAARRAIQGARPYAFNAFKVEMAREAIVRSLSIAGGLA